MADIVVAKDVAGTNNHMNTLPRPVRPHLDLGHVYPACKKKNASLRDSKLRVFFAADKFACGIAKHSADYKSSKLANTD